MALVIAQLAMPLLAILALARILRPQPVASPVAGTSTHPSLAALSGTSAASPEQAELKRKLLYAVGITAGICVLAFLAGLGADFAAPIDAQLQQQGFPLDALRADRASVMRSDVFRSIIFIVLTGGVLYFYLQRKLSVTSAALLVGALTLVDLWAVDKRYLNDNNFQRETIAQQFVPTPADEAILQDKDLSYRVLNTQNPFNEANTSYFHKSVGGYHGAKLRRYQDLVDYYGRQVQDPQTGVVQTILQPTLMSMLNTRYLISNDPKQPVQRNPGALGNAWFVSEVQKVQNPDQEIAALATLNVASVAVVDASKFPLAKTTYNAAGSTIALTSYSPDELKYRATAVQDGFVVFSEIYYQDGWNAYLDGKLVPHLRANYVLRALPVPAGTHTIEFKFEPKEYAVGNTVSLVSSVLLILALLGTIVYALKRKPTGPVEEVRLAA
ncbi:YfhO family protein [Hymenobacter cellulosilyticus]|uniref:YfhO family protein n=1 Tax=Hymenobacter cellulosilyticus TaxID=2932248 RepID=A0A8T9QFZ3_9BACT|nr:YfhO family protein [Hymenobacter cellulosilyticus]UOQ73753.1 YfhO family protein [Hymenobacter cellulosilyticus]